MANHKKTETAARLKKFYATLSNVVKQSEIDQGLPAKDWPKVLGTREYFDKYLAKYFKYNKIDKDNWHLENDGTHAWVISIYLDDGTIIGLDYLSMLYYDVNGDKGPNEYGRDVFEFNINSMFDETTYIDDFYCLPTIQADHYLCDNIPTREEAKNSCGKTAPNNRNLCTYLIQLDGWEIKDDYPLKL